MEHGLFEILLQQIDDAVQEYWRQHGKYPRTVVLPRGQYILLEDYCRERETARLTEAMVRLACESGAERAVWQRQKQAAGAALERLRRQGITELICSYGPLSVRVDPARDDLSVE